LDVFTVPSIPLPIVNADDNFGYSLGIRLTEECKAQIKEFDPSLVHFTVPDFLALDALRWAKAEVRWGLGMRWYWWWWWQWWWGVVDFF
jgi:hypothetical protein